MSMKHLAAWSLALLLFTSVTAPAGAVTSTSGSGVSSGGSIGVKMVDPASAGSWKFSKNLFFGMKNDPQVMELQEFLTDQGYYAGPVTGNYFLLTMQAVKKFQSANGVTPSGYFGTLSRGKANTILERLVSFICPPEEGCSEPIQTIPNPSLTITAQSDLSGKTGTPFTAIFKVSGGSGSYYDIQGSGEVPGLTWTRNDCPPGVYCIKGADPDSITLTGTPRKAGVYTVTVVAREDVVSPCKEAKVNAPCPLLYPMGKYGKASFTVVVRGEGTSTGPVVKGVKGPAELKMGEEGTWSIQATGKGSLSYSVIWGDEVSMDISAGMAQRLTIPPFVQTATFSHRYQNPGVYTAIFKVADEQGNVATATLGVKVGDVLVQAGGTLEIDPLRMALKSGEQAKFMAYYQPAMPPCPTGFFCAQMMPPRVPVKASWSSSDTSIASVQEMGCAAQEGVGACPNVVYVTAGRAGTATIIATYFVGGVELKAKAAVVVSGSDMSAGSLMISPNVGDLKLGGSTSFNALYQPPLPPCAYATSGAVCKIAAIPPYPVNVEWYIGDASIAELSVAIGDCPPPSPNAILCRGFTSAQVTGKAVGATTLTAVYSAEDGSRLKAFIPIRVSN